MIDNKGKEGYIEDLEMDKAINTKNQYQNRIMKI